MKTDWTSFDREWGLEPLPPANAPVFLLACIWRTGSTLMQRLLCSSGELLLWGEPYANSMPVQHMHRTALPLLHAGLPKDHFIERTSPNRWKEIYADLGRYWIANIYPDPAHIRAAHRKMLDTLFRDSANKLGFPRFGLKEVRLNGDHAQYLKWLYPDARFVFLVRNPWDAWNSYRGAQWYYAWPDLLITSVEQFSQLWLQNLDSLLSWKDESIFLVRYEDILREEAALDQVQEHCMLENIDRTVMQAKITGLEKTPGEITPEESRRIALICGERARQLGYYGHRRTD